jgi:hypothetical protein
VNVLPLDGGDGSIASLWNGPEAQWDSEAETLGVKIDLSIDGGETFLEDVVDFMYYSELEWEVKPNLGGPMSGETEIEFDIVGANTNIDASGEAAVKFFTEDGSFEKISSANCELVKEGARGEGEEEEEKGEDQEKGWRLKVTCNAPEFDWGAGEGKEEEKEGGVEEGEGEEEESEEGEGVGVEGDGGEEGEEIATPVVKKTLAQTKVVLVEVAYNGVNFVPNCGTYEYYPSPQVSGLSKDVVGRAGTTLVVSGSGFFDSEAIKVKFESDDSGVVEIVEGKLTGGGAGIR